MRKSIQLSLLSLIAGFGVAVATGQSSPTPPALPTRYFKADFVVKEVDATGHLTNSRNYSTILATNNQPGPNQIRSGDRIPIRTNSGGKGDIAYIDTGVNIDCRAVHEVDQRLAVSITVEISSAPAGTDLRSTLDPLIRTFKWNADVLIAPRVQTTIFSSDDVSSKTKIEFEVTATPIR